MGCIVKFSWRSLYDLQYYWSGETLPNLDDLGVDLDLNEHDLNEVLDLVITCISILIIVPLSS